MPSAASQSAADAPPDQADFPDWLDPMMVKELRQGLRARWFVVPFLAVQAAAAGLVWMEYWLAKVPGGNPAAVMDGGLYFWLLVHVAAALLLPLRCLGSLGEELEGGNAGLVLLAGISRWKIALGKWLTQMLLTGLVLLSLLPYGIVRYFFGGVEFAPNLAALLNVIGAAAAINALFLGASGYAHYWMRAAIALAAVAYVAVLAAAGWWISFAITQELTGSVVALLFILYMLLGQAAMYLFFTLCGLQLARAKLRESFRPWEVPPARPVLVIFFLAPLYFGLGSVVTCGMGWPVLAGLMVWWVRSIDSSRGPHRRFRTAVHSISRPFSTLPSRVRF